MLPKKNLIPLRTEFRSIRAEGRMVNGPLFGVIIRQTDQPLVPRFGFVVTKKAIKLAVRRNEVKRKLAVVVRPYTQSLKDGIEVVYLIKGGLTQATKKKTEEEVRRILSPYLK